MTATSSSVAAVRQGADPPGGLEAVHAGHAEIEEHDVRPERRRLVDGIGAVVGRADLAAERAHHHRQAVGAIAIVVGDHHAAAERRRRDRIVRHRRGAGRGPRERQADLERAALIEARAARRHAAAVQVDQALHQRQADADAALRPRPRL